MMRPLATLLVAATLAACAEPTSPAAMSAPSLRAEVTRSTITTELTGLQTPNPCTGETITVEGWLKERIQQVISASEDTVFRIHQTAHASGISDLGVRYQLILATSATIINMGTSGVDVLSVPFTLKIVGAGPSNDSSIRSIVHISSNAHGVPTAHVDLGEVSCQ